MGGSREVGPRLFANLMLDRLSDLFQHPNQTRLTAASATDEDDEKAYAFYHHTHLPTFLATGGRPRGSLLRSPLLHPAHGLISFAVGSRVLGPPQAVSGARWMRRSRPCWAMFAHVQGRRRSA